MVDKDNEEEQKGGEPDDKEKIMMDYDAYFR